jgi:Single-strand binding protein family
MALISTFAGYWAHFLDVHLCCTAVVQRITSRADVNAARRAASSQNGGEVWVDVANVMPPNWSRSAQPYPLPRRGRAATPSLAGIRETWTPAVLSVMNSRREQEASFFTVVVWRDQAEHAAESLSMGCRVVVVGRL